MLKIADNLKLPIEAVTQTFAVLAKRGVGKSYLAAVVSEEMLKAKQPVVIIDPTGAHWGLRASADGKQAGFPIVVFGGDRGDLPLEEAAGEIVAASIIENRFPAILDLSHFRKGQSIRFMTAFLESLYRLNREALHLVVDEADTFAPQRLMGEEARMCGAMEDVVKKGRIRGLGCTLITQRPAVLNKNVLTQCESLFVMRLVHPKDIDAIKEWVGVHASVEEAQKVIESLPSLAVGTAWLWSPGWLGTLKQINVRRRETFDSSATPKPGQVNRQPKKLAAVDLAKLGEKIQATVETAKANDPKELRRRLAEAEKQLAQRAGKPATAATAPDAKVLERARQEGEKAAERRYATEVRSLRAQAQKLGDALLTIQQRAGKALDLLLNNDVQPTPAASSETANSRIPGIRESVVSRGVRPLPLQPNKPPRDPAADNGSLPLGERKVLTAIAQHSEGVSREQLTVLTGYKKSSRDTYLQKLGQQGFIERAGDNITATAEGVAALGGSFEPLPTGDELYQHWIERLPAGERQVLEVIAGQHPDACSREFVGEQTNYKKSSRDTYLQKLIARKLVIVDGPGQVRASDQLFG